MPAPDKRIKPILDRIDSGFREVSIDVGWYDIVASLDRELSNLDPKYVVHQVKEKFGGLRYYCSLKSEEAKTLIERAEEEASRTCEKCGRPGVFSPFVVRCAECK
jgi:hypothetical protein